MSLTQREAEYKSNRRKRSFKRRNRYASYVGENAFKHAVEDTKKALKWMEKNPGKALPLGY